MVWSHSPLPRPVLKARSWSSFFANFLHNLPKKLFGKCSIPAPNLHTTRGRREQLIRNIGSPQRCCQSHFLRISRTIANLRPRGASSATAFPTTGGQERTMSTMMLIAIFQCFLKEPCKILAHKLHTNGRSRGHCSATAGRQDLLRHKICNTDHPDADYMIGLLFCVDQMQQVKGNPFVP